MKVCVKNRFNIHLYKIKISFYQIFNCTDSRLLNFIKTKIPIDLLNSISLIFRIYEGASITTSTSPSSDITFFFLSPDTDVANHPYHPLLSSPQSLVIVFISTLLLPQKKKKSETSGRQKDTKNISASPSHKQTCSSTKYIKEK